MSTLNCWICRHSNVSQSKNTQLIDYILDKNEKLECPICYDEFNSNNLFFTECKHYACYNCINSLLKINFNEELISRRSHIYIIAINDINILLIYIIKIQLICIFIFSKYLIKID